MSKLTPCLWFNFNAEEAVNFYRAVFGDVEVLDTSRYGESMPDLAGKVLMMRFRIGNQELLALNGGPQFPFTEAVSIMVDAADQAEVDRLWNALTSDGGAPSQCGWLKDRYGLSWQIVPSILPKLLQSGDAQKSGRVMEALMKMKKIDIAALQAAHDGR